MKKIFFSIFICLIFLSGCSAPQHDTGISGFTSRLSALCPDETVSAEGFIDNTDEHFFYRFFKTDKSDIMLCLGYCEDGRLDRCDIVFDKRSKDDKKARDFIMNCINAYFDSDEDAAAVTLDVKLEDTMFEPTLKTKSAESGRCKLMLDVNAVGTVITLFKDTV